MALKKHSYPVTFTHAVTDALAGGPLTVHTGLDAAAWAYSVNVQTFPTYKGEVVQILSVFIDNLTIQGTCHSYDDVERIYKYFWTYTQVASQGRTRGAEVGETAYNQEPMTMQYAHRSWAFKLMPIAMPGFRYGRDVVAPQWRVQAHIVDDGGDVEYLKNSVAQHVIDEANQGDFSLQGQIGYVADNPFSEPFVDGKGKFDPSQTADAFGHLADWYNSLIPSYLQHDFGTLTGDLGSKPAFGNWGPQYSDKSTKDQKKRVDQLVRADAKQRDTGNALGTGGTIAIDSMGELTGG
jgi:hypothetical protein